MCGIIGYISDKMIDIAPAMEAIKHRGPDASGRYDFKFGNHFVGLGHLRLSIIDLSQEANQPFHRENCSIIFNGEIYNYKELRSRLMKKGYGLLTSSDTEVLLCMYLEYGVEMLNKLRGMFAFAIWDQQNSKMIVARDHLGIKPVYYYSNEKSFYFASEIKALSVLPGVRLEVDETCITEFLLNGFLYEPDTGFKRIKKILPGTYYEIDLTSSEVQTKELLYWRPAMTNNKNEEKVSEIIDKSIADHVVSDVPVGLFFSGGIDSSIILNNLRNRVQSFILKASDKEYEYSGMANDYTYASEIAQILKVELESIQISENDDLTGKELLRFIIFLSKATEELIADFTFISSQLLSRAARKKGFIVMLSGMGADEIFAGYPRYRMVRYKRVFKILRTPIILLFSRWKYFSKKIERFNSFLEETDFIFGYTSLVGVFSKNEIESLLKEKASFEQYHEKLSLILNGFERESGLKKAMILDRLGFLSHNFLVADKSSMLESIELRVPLATRELMEKSLSMKDKKLVKFLKGKLPLRKILYEVFPSRIVDRRKAGFNAPLDRAINDLGAEQVLSFMTENGLFKYVQSQPVQKILDDHFLKVKNNTYKIFVLLYLSAWFKSNEII